MNGELRQYAPTTRRLASLRQAGIFPRSRVLTAGVVVGAAILTVAGLGRPLLGTFSRLVAGLLGAVAQSDLSAALRTPSVLTAGLSTVAFLAGVWLVAVGAEALQRRAAPGAEASAAASAERQQVSYRRLWAADLAWELVVSAAILAGGALIIYDRLPALLHVSPHQPALMVSQLQQVLWAFAWRFALLMIGLGLCDYLYRRAIFWQAAAMTRQELQQEIRETEPSWVIRWWRQRRMRRY